MALRKPIGHACGDSPQASPPRAAAKHVARVERFRQLFREAYPCHPPEYTMYSFILNSHLLPLPHKVKRYTTHTAFLTNCHKIKIVVYKIIKTKQISRMTFAQLEKKGRESFP
jgi:hypothetical protein